MNSLYKKELMYTVVFTILLLVTGHFASIFVAFPALQRGSLWGFPVHYIVPILVGWFGVSIVSWVMAYYCNKLDDELDNYAAMQSAAAKEEK